MCNRFSRPFRSVYLALSAGLLLLLVLAGMGVAWPFATGEENETHERAGVPVRLVAVASFTDPGPSYGFTTAKSSFSVTYDSLEIPYRMMGIFVLPEEEVNLRTLSLDVRGPFRLEAEAGEVSPRSAGAWTWTAPSTPGVYTITVRGVLTGETVRLNAFVKTPFAPTHAALGEYRIGHYELEPYQGNPSYVPPQGFIKVTPANRDVQVSPHFTLGQFLCKQASGWPKYVALSETLLLKLETLLQEVNALQGIEAQTLHVMSGYRTPHYNKTIGNSTEYSRHLYGDAADVFVDIDGDHYMDDLNGDGTVTVDDAELLADLATAHADEDWYTTLIGGLGIYGSAPHRGPFIHIDTRGRPTRW